MPDDAAPDAPSPDGTPDPGFVGSLVATNDRRVDSLIVMALAFGASLIAFQGYQLWLAPAAFNALNFCTGGGMLLAALGGGRALRSWNAPGGQ